MERSKRIGKSTVRRSMVLIVAFMCVAAAISGKLAYIQIVQYEHYKGQVYDQITLETEVNPERGSIYDCNGNILASNATVYLIFISPEDILKYEPKKDEDKKEIITSWTSADGTVYSNKDAASCSQMICRFLSETLDVDYAKVVEKAAKAGRRYEEIKKNVDVETAEKVRAFVEEHSFTRQIYLKASSIRSYPYGNLASHVLGFTDSDGIGLYGLENYYNNVMEGTSGRYITAQDARSQDMPFKYETYVEAEDGYSINTTIDMYMQYELENQLEAAMRDSAAANRVCGIIMDVNTGGVYAMGVYPDFDCNSPRQLDEFSLAQLEGMDENSDEYKKKRLDLLYAMWKNKAVTELYEPGSTTKIMTTAMALEEKVTSLDDRFYCPGYMNIEGYPRPIHCHKRVGHGSVSLVTGLQQSCNPTMMTLALRLGHQTFYNYFLAFGYGDVTGIDLPGEAPTIYHKNFKDFTTASLAVYSFGQTFKTTAIQQLAAISSVANGGSLVTPHFLKEIVDGDGNVIQKYETDVKRQIVSKETCDTLSAVLEDGVSGDGGAKNAYVKGYKVAAKTGTSEKRDDDSSKRIGSCVAYAPADDPQIAVIIIVDEPTSGPVYGSTVAAPYVSNLLSFVLPYMGIEPQYSENEMGAVEVNLVNYVGSTVANAKSDLSSRGIQCSVVGSGDTVTAQIPEPGSSVMKESGKVILYTGGEEPQADATVPDLIGKTVEAANRLVTNAGLNISIKGASGDGATVITQTPAAGESVPKGTTVSIEMRHMDIADD